MAKLVLAMFMSLDGCVAGPDGTLQPPPWSDEVADAWAGENLRNARHLLYGRVNFLFNRDFWTSSAATSLPWADTMNALPKTVVSRTLTGDSGWNGTVVAGDLPAAIGALKQSVPEGDIYSFGGANLARSLMSDGLVDEFRLMVAPRVQGDGQRLFTAGVPALGLELLEARTLDVGSVILRYRRV